MTDVLETYKQYQQRLSELYAKINDLHAQVSDIDQQQSSFVISAWQFLGYDEVGILEDKKRDILAEIDLLTKQIDTFQKGIQDLSAELRQEGIQEQQKIVAQQRAIEEKKYLNSPDVFFEEVLFNNNVISQVSTDEIYSHSRKIIAASAVINTQPNIYRMIQALKIVSEARNRSFAEYRKATQKNDISVTEQKFAVADEFAQGSKICFFNMVDKFNNKNLQLLKILYLIDPERSEWYYGQSGIDTDPKIFAKLEAEINVRQMKEAEERLKRIRGFVNLSASTRQQLTQQQLYVDKLDLDLQLANVGDKRFLSLENYSQKLHDNIKNAILNNRTLSDLERETDLLKQKINKEAESIRTKFFWEKFGESSQVPAAASAAVWITGFGLPVALATAAVTAAVKANFQTSKSRLQTPKIDRDKELVDKIGPQDLEFLQQSDLKWNKISPAPTSSSANLDVKVKTLKDDADEFVNYAKDKFNKNVDEHVINPVNEVFFTAKILYAGLAMLSVVILVSIAIALPATWPFLAVVATIGSMALAYKFMPRNKLPSIIDRFTNTNTNFVFPKESLQKLQSSAPGSANDLAKLLSEHFHRRLAVINAMLEEARNNKDYVQQVAVATKKLEDDWNVIIQASKQPELFCERVEAYLENSYEEARDHYIAAAMKNVDNSSVTKQDNKERIALLFTKDRPAYDIFKMNFNVDYTARQQEIKELLTLKNKVSQMKTEVRR